MCFVAVCSTAPKERATRKKVPYTCKTTHCRTHLEQIVFQRTPFSILDGKSVLKVFTTQGPCPHEETTFQPCDVTIADHIKEAMSGMCGTLTVDNSTAIVHSDQCCITRDKYIACLSYKNDKNSLKSLSVSQSFDMENFEWCNLVSEWSIQETTNSKDSKQSTSPFKGPTPIGRQHKGGSKSSTSSSSSSQRSGSGSGNGHRQGTASGSSGRGRVSGHGYSSGSTDSSEDDKDDDDKRRRPYRKHNKEPKSKPGFSDDEDDEATDSADEGVSQDTPTSIMLDFSPQSQKSDTNNSRRGGNKERFRSDMPNSLPGVGKSVTGSDGLISTISVESIISSKGRVESSVVPVPQSPINMAVGYGIPKATVAPPSVLDNIMDTQPSQTATSKTLQESGSNLNLGTPTLDSPRPLGDKDLNSPGTPPPMSPEIAPSFSVETSSSANKLNRVPSMSLPAQSSTSALPGPSGFGTLPFETTWGWQPPVYSPFALPGGSHPGSVATTPAPTSDNSGGFLRPGTAALLQATVCQESEGVLIVTVRWRNRNFSGSLIDVGHHDWAPPRLSCPYGEIQLKDLYKQKEAESQSVNVDVLDEAKPVTHTQTKSEPATISNEAPKKEIISVSNKLDAKTKPVLDASVPMETESITVMASSNPSEVNMVETSSSVKSHNRNLLTKPSTDKAAYSDISDASDNENGEGGSKSSKRLTKEAKQNVEPHPSNSTASGFNMGSINGLFPYKLEGGKADMKAKESALATKLSAHLPTFGEVGRPQKNLKKEEAKQGDEFIPDSQPSSPSSSSKQPSSSAAEVRTQLLSMYPITNTSSSTVSMPEQDQRHSIASKTTPSNGSSSPKINKKEKNHDHSALQTLSDVAASLKPVDEKEKQASKLTKFSITSFTQKDFQSGVRPDKRSYRRSVSPRPNSLVPKPNGRRSPSPKQFTKQTLEQHAANLPSFDAAPGPRRAVASETKPTSSPVDFKPATCLWGSESLPAREEDDHDSDSSGSGALISTHRQPEGTRVEKRSKTAPLTEIPTVGKPPREESGAAKQPQTPALPPIPYSSFNLGMIQPISPGVEGPHPHPSSSHHSHHSHKHGTTVTTSHKRGLPDIHQDAKKGPPSILQENSTSSTAVPTSVPHLQGRTVGECLKNVSIGPHHIAVSSGQVVHSSHPVVSVQNVDNSPTHSNSVRMYEIGSNVETDKDRRQSKTVKRHHSNEDKGNRNEQQSFDPYVTTGQHHLVKLVHSRESHAVIHVPDDRRTPSPRLTPKNDMSLRMNSDLNTVNGRKRKVGPDMPYEMSKRLPPNDREDVMDHRPTVRSKQLTEGLFGDEGKDNMKELPSGFEAVYDPNLPMSMKYQLIAYMHQKKLQDEHQQEMDKPRMYPDGGTKKLPHNRSRRHTSNDHLNAHQGSQISKVSSPSVVGHETKPMRHSSIEGPHHPMANIPVQTSGHIHAQQQNGPSVITSHPMIKSEPEEVHYLATSKGQIQSGGVAESMKPSSTAIRSTPSKPSQNHARKQTSSVRRPEPMHIKNEDRPGFRPTPPPSHSPHPVAIPGYSGMQWTTVPTQLVEREVLKSKHEAESGTRDHGNKKTPSSQPSEWRGSSNSSFSPVIAHQPHQGGRPPTSSPSHPHSSHHHQSHREHSQSTSNTSMSRADRDREITKHGHSYARERNNQEHERVRETDRERAVSLHQHPSHHPRQNSSSSTSSNHSTSQPSSSSGQGSSRGISKDQSTAAINATQQQQQQQLLQMQQLATLQQLQQLSPNTLATIQRGGGGIPNAAIMEEYMKQIQQMQQQQYEMLQKAAAVHTPTTLTPAPANQQELIQWQMQMAAAQMGLPIDPNAAMALMLQQNQAVQQAQVAQVQAQQQAQQQQQQAQQQQEAQAQAAAAAQHAALIQAAQSSMIPLMYPIAATSGQIPQTFGFYDPNTMAAGMPIPFAAVPKRD